MNLRSQELEKDIVVMPELETPEESSEINSSNSSSPKNQQPEAYVTSDNSSDSSSDEKSEIKEEEEQEAANDNVFILDNLQKMMEELEGFILRGNQNANQQITMQLKVLVAINNALTMSVASLEHAKKHVDTFAEKSITKVSQNLTDENLKDAQDLTCTKMNVNQALTAAKDAKLMLEKELPKNVGRNPSSMFGSRYLEINLSDLLGNNNINNNDFKPRGSFGGF